MFVEEIPLLVGKARTCAHPVRGGVVMVVDGEGVLSTLAEVVAITRANAKQAPLGSLYDLRRIAVTITVAEALRALRVVLPERQWADRAWPLAVVMPSGSWRLMMAQTYAVMAAAAGLQRKVFTDYEAAWEWITRRAEVQRQHLRQLAQEQ